MRGTLKFVIVAALLSALLASPALASVTKSFSISGTSTGAGWSYNLSGVGLPNVSVTTEGVPSGGSAEALARQWVRSINLSQGQPPAYRAVFVKVGEDGKAYFTITAPNDFDFSVNGCKITGNPNGCSFNPTVQEVHAIPAN